MESGSGGEHHIGGADWIQCGFLRPPGERLHREPLRKPPRAHPGVTVRLYCTVTVTVTVTVPCERLHREPL
eukprot:631826-Prorocentrum_minimum.AAC.1